MDRKQFFTEFRQTMEKKYGHMADDMIDFFKEVSIFFREKDIDISKFAKKHINILLNDYLDFDDLTDAECSMMFQGLIDFCDFCKKKNIDYEFFKTYLLKHKYDLYDRWNSFEESLEDLDEDIFNDEHDEHFDNRFPEIEPEDLLNNFDSVYDLVRNLELKNKKPNNPRIIRFLERVYEVENLNHEMSTNPSKVILNTTEKQLMQIMDKKERFFDESSEIQPLIFFLPKPLAKQFFMIMFKMEESEHYKIGSSEKVKILKESLVQLKTFIDEIKKLNGKKNK